MVNKYININIYSHIYISHTYITVQRQTLCPFDGQPHLLNGAEYIILYYS